MSSSSFFSRSTVSAYSSIIALRFVDLQLQGLLPADHVGTRSAAEILDLEAEALRLRERASSGGTSGAGRLRSRYLM